MDEGVEVPAVELFAQKGLGGADLGERADAVGIAADHGELGASIVQRAGGAAGRAAVADDQHG